MGVGGNLWGSVLVKVAGCANTIKENAPVWKECMRLQGWLDLSTGDSDRRTFSAKIQESTHIFLCDYQPMAVKISVGEQETNVDITSENARMVIDGLVYDVLLIDNPMNRNEHYEIYLKFVGGQNGN